MITEQEIQHQYYKVTAEKYDATHLGEVDIEHVIACHYLLGMIDYLKIQSILDIGSGTGRVIRFFKTHKPELVVKGIEPVKELREIAYLNGVSKSDLVDGDALALTCNDESYDIVTAFGVLHHIRDHKKAVDEMLRVSKTGIFLSDANNYGQGGKLVRKIKQISNSLKLWPLMNYIKTGGKGYSITEGDGLAYSYSLFSNYAQIEKKCSNVYLMNTKGNAINMYREASHLALLGIKNQS
ncbi:MAG: class I SAM-dependent methyltransferase [Gammaproteobacteria bacterium]|nr:class I SAM-dependent methyltransferase [Gammaproteobacteria bacterium]